MTPRAIPTPKVTEAEFQKVIIELAKTLGYEYLHVRKAMGRRNGQAGWQTPTNLKGWVDLLLWKPGRVVAVELKSATGRVEPEQAAVHASLAATGLVEVHVWRPSDFETAVRVLRHGGDAK